MCVFDELKWIPEVIVPAVCLKQLGSSSVVLSLSVLPEIVFVRLPNDLTHDASVIEIVNTDPSSKTDVPTSAERDEFHPWIAIPSEAFGTVPGKQTYQIKFQKLVSEEKFSLYFSVIIQNDDPEKPYIYMDRSSKDVQSN